MNDTHKAALEAQIRRDGGLRDAPDGPLLPTFAPLELAAAIESEIARGASLGHTKVVLRMDTADAAAFAGFLRRAALRGA